MREIDRDKLITPPLDISEYDEDILRKIYHLIHDHKMEKVCRKSKFKYEDSYPYICNDYIGIVGSFMKKLGLNSVVDLGCGLAFGILCLEKEFNFKVGGYDINKDLLIGLDSERFKEKDILKLTTDDIKDYEVIYFYDPFITIYMKYKFIENLIKIMLPGQHVIMRDSGAWYSTDIFLESESMETVFFDYKYIATSIHKKI